MKKIIVLMCFVLALSLDFIYATPSTQIWNPSTDIQSYKTFHLGIDNYFSVSNNDDKPYAAGTLTGITYGLFKNFEAGIDILEPSQDPLYFNLKYGIPESNIPAFAIGAFNVGTKTDVTNYNIFYGVMAKTFNPIGRLSLGYYAGNDKLLIDENGNKANTGVIASWDKALTEKIWASIDYASGKSFYGSFSLGCSYLFAPNTSVIFGYVIYNNTNININNQFTTQLDINF